MGRSTWTLETIGLGTFFRDSLPRPPQPQGEPLHGASYVTLWEGTLSDPRQSTQNQLPERILQMLFQNENCDGGVAVWMGAGL